jgi:hypothetical protein
MGLTFSNTAATTAAVANRIVTIANMKVGTYTIANASPVWAGGALITITHATVAAGTDTLGTVTIDGTGITGAVQSEVITPLADTVATGTKIFRSVTAVTGAGWVIAGGNDTITVGVAAGNYVAATGGVLGGVLVNNTVAAAVVVSAANGTIITIPASQAAGTYYNLGGVEYSGWLKVATTNTNDVTVFHSGTIPAFATA